MSKNKPNNGATFSGFQRWDCVTRAVTLQIPTKACPFPPSCPFVCPVSSFPAMQVTPGPSLSSSVCNSDNAVTAAGHHPTQQMAARSLTALGSALCVGAAHPGWHKCLGFVFSLWMDPLVSSFWGVVSWSAGMPMLVVYPDIYLDFLPWQSLKASS